MPSEATLANIFRFFQSTVRLGPDGEVFVPTTKQATLTATLKFFTAGAVAGAVSRTLTAPLDRMRVALQVSAEANASQSRLLVAFRSVYSKGILSFFRGNGLSVLKITPESAIKFTAYEKIRSLFISRKGGDSGSSLLGMNQLSVPERLLSGGLAGVASQSGIYPLEVLKTRVMSSSATSKGLLFLTAKNMYREGGLRTFYRGFVPSMVGIFPFAAIDLGVFDFLKQSYVREQRRLLEDGMEVQKPGVVRTLLYGMLSGMTASLCVYPIGLVRTR